VMEFIAKQNNVTVLNHETISVDKKKVDDPMSEVEALSSTWKPVKVDGIPDTFCGNIIIPTYTYDFFLSPSLF
jgi:anthranilate synthase component I